MKFLKQIASGNAESSRSITNVLVTTRQSEIETRSNVSQSLFEIQTPMSKPSTIIYNHDRFSTVRRDEMI